MCKCVYVDMQMKRQGEYLTQKKPHRYRRGFIEIKLFKAYFASSSSVFLAAAFLVAALVSAPSICSFN